MMEYKNTFGEKVLKKYLEEEVSEKNGLDESASKPLEKVYAGDEQGYEDDEEMEYLKETDPTNIEMQETENTIQHLEIQLKKQTDIQMELEKMKERGSENTLKYTELSNEYNALKKATDKIIQTEGGVKVIDLEQQINQRKMILNPEDASMN